MAIEPALDPVVLDHISTSQKTRARCGYGAPLIAIVTAGAGTVKQACCNHWDCPRCRFTLAAYHSHRITEGAEILSKQGPLYFITITCRGKDLDLETADDSYLLWTNRLLSACRARAKKQGIFMVYVQVTERQKRGAAHSHIITNFCPDDARVSPTKSDPNNIVSEWFIKVNVSAGLGPQCRISLVREAGAAGGYVAKYLNKELAKSTWPPNWKRVRYSQRWPDRAIIFQWASTLIRQKDWDKADEQGVYFTAEDETTYQLALHHMARIRREIVTQQD